MMNLCKTVHTLLGFPNPDEHSRDIPHRCRNIPSPDGDGLRCIASAFPKSPANVLESSAVIGSSKPPPEKPDPLIHGSCFHPNDDCGGLELCTERLGFESCCDGRMGEEEEMAEEEIRRRIEEGKRSLASGGSRKKTTRSSRRAEAKKFPPPLPWLDGKSGGAFMRGVRKDGRFVLTEVRVERPEILLASRQDGRLRLQLVVSQEVEEEMEKVVVAEEKEEVVVEKVEEEELERGGGGEDEDEEEKEEVERLRLWQAAMKRSEGWSGRCQTAASHHFSSCWNHRFVTTA